MLTGKHGTGVVSWSVLPIVFWRRRFAGTFPRLWRISSRSKVRCSMAPDGLDPQLIVLAAEIAKDRAMIAEIVQYLGEVLENYCVDEPPLVVVHGC